MKKIATAALLLLITTLGWAQSVEFSNKGGFQDAAFDLTLTASDGQSAIYYTLDGTIPTTKNATRYTSPLHITTTTPVSAICVNADGMVSPNVVRTYIFLKDVYKQPAAPKGYPTTWTTGYKAYYQMDQNITLGSTYGPMMDDAMRSLPIVCVTTTISNLFDQNKGDKTGGIYIFPEEKGDSTEWERPASIEYYDSKGFIQQNCGIRIHGGNSRKPGNSAKHSFRISFRKQYGKGKIKYAIFDDEDAVDKFDHLVLRAGYNNTWIKNGSKTLYPQNIIQRTNAQYITDSWTKEAAHAMGHLFTHRRFAHLFINGLYWGMYEIAEKIGDKFVVQYLGGMEDDWDVVEDHKGVIDGDRTAFNDMFATALKATSTGTYYNRLMSEQLLDIRNFVEYMLLQWYIGNEDWDENNWRAVRNRVSPDGGFKFLVWDAEMGMTDVNINKVTLKKGEPTQMMDALKKNPEVKAIIQECVERHLTGNGILTPSRAAELYERLAQEIDLAIICESARWGGYRKFTGESDITYTRNDNWLPRKESLLKDYFTKRSDVLLKQLQAAGLFDATGISDITIDEPSAASARYNLNGQKIGKSYRGIVIENGRKMMK